MKNKLKNFKTAFAAEHIKKRGTGIYTVAFIMGLLGAAIVLVVNLVEDFEIKTKIPYNYYLKFIYGTGASFASFFLPVLIIITASRIAQLDHKNGGWQLMEIQPFEKASIYFSKFGVLLVSVLISILAFTGSSLLVAWLLTFVQEIPAHAILDFPFQEIMSLSFRIFMAASVVIALQYFLAVLIPGFVWPMLVGFLCLIATPILSQFNLMPAWFPYEILIETARYQEGSDIGKWLLYTEKISLIQGVFFLLMGFALYSNKTFKRSFLASKTKIATAVGTLAVFGLLTAFLVAPNSYGPHNKTVIAGRIESDAKFQQAYLIHPTIGDTIAVIDIKNNAWSQEIKADLPLDAYYLIFSDALKVDVLISNKDSVFTAVKYYRDVETKVTGTRLAEHQFKEDNSTNSYMIPYYLQNNINIDQPDSFLKELYEAWEKEYKNSSSFKTKDNFVPKSDFIELNKKAVCVKYLGYLNQFLEKRKALYPNQKTVLTADIKKIQAKISLHEESLISKQYYLDYLIHEISKSDNRDIDRKIKEIEAICKLKPSNFKNRLLFSYLKTNLEEASGSAERTALVTNYANQIQDAKLLSYIKNYYKIYERLGKGNVARDFAATAIDGRPVALSGLKGKFVVVDLWATWCNPCRQQSPYFEEMAIKYKKENVQFVALSIDKDVKNWYIDAKSKSKSVLQLHANDIEGISNDYNIVSIPRFILIDAEGKIYNSKMPYPNEDSFEMVLRKALNLKETE